MIYSENILICIEIPLLISLLFIDRASRRFVGSFIAGMIVCLLSAYITAFLSRVSGLDSQSASMYYSPVVEETMKMLPLLFYMFVFYPKDRRLFICGTGIGLGFATFENCCYMLSSGSEDFTYILIRGMAVGVLHLVCALALVIILTDARKHHVLSVAGVFGALSLSVTLHGLYNLLVSEPGISSYIGYILPAAASAALYIPGRRRIMADGGDGKKDAAAGTK
jgi:RsiW-degrading membrane proteinase PrsW (M82 family)